jgi:hypothetical protein
MEMAMRGARCIVVVIFLFTTQLRFRHLVVYFIFHAQAMAWRESRTFACGARKSTCLPVDPGPTADRTEPSPPTLL